MIRKILLFSVLFSCFMYAGEAVYEIKSLDSSDSVYMKFKKDIQKNHLLWEKVKKKFNMDEIKEFKKLSIAIYRVKANDTIFSISEKLGMVVDTLISFNSLASNLSIKTGDELLIPNMDGVVLFPKKEVYIQDIEKTYQVPNSLLMYINGIHREFVYAKEEVFIPFARMTEDEKNYFLAKPFIFPIKEGKFTSNYGLRLDPFNKKKMKFHGGFDVGTPVGTKIFASADGEVIFSGWGDDYGKLVVIRHKYDYTTWYGHLSNISVKKGEWVLQGKQIGLSGNTGRSTGPHLHFELRRFNLRKNPLEVLDFTHPMTN